MDYEEIGRRLIAEAANDPAGFEERFKGALEDALVGERRFEAEGNDGVWVEGIQMAGSYPGTELSIVLRDDAQPGCRFVEGPWNVWDEQAFGTIGPDPERHALWQQMALQEDIDAIWHGLPIRCQPGELTRVGEHRVTLKEAMERAPFPLLIPTQLPAPAEPDVVFEDRRRFFPFASVRLVYPYPDGHLVSCQAERLRQRAPRDGWEEVQREIEGRPAGAAILEQRGGEEARFTVWADLKPARTVKVGYEGFSIWLQTDFLDASRLLEVAFSFEDVTSTEDDGG